MNLPSTFAMQADSAEAPRVAPLAEQPRSPDSLLPIAFSFAPRQPLPRALAGTPVHRTNASTPAVIFTRAGKRSLSEHRSRLAQPRETGRHLAADSHTLAECWVSKDSAHRR